MKLKPPSAPPTDTEIDRYKERAITAHRTVLQCADDLVQAVFECGESLTLIKNRLRHGQWLDWLAANFPASARSAQNYMILFSLMQAMPDMRKELVGRSLGGAMHLLQIEYDRRDAVIEKRVTGLALDLVELNKLHAQAIVQLQRALKDIKAFLRDEEAWQQWCGEHSYACADVQQFMVGSVLAPHSKAHPPVHLFRLPGTMEAHRLEAAVWRTTDEATLIKNESVSFFAKDEPPPARRGTLRSQFAAAAAAADLEDRVADMRGEDKKHTTHAHKGNGAGPKSDGDSK